MPSKFFLLEVTSDESTRWNTTDAEFSAALCILGTSAAKIWTDGAEPEVSVRLLCDDKGHIKS